MATDWRGLFNEISVSWIDRGKNVARGNVYIQCVNCDDPSYHLGISETKDAFYCWRCTYGGTNLANLLTRLGLRYHDVAGLLNRHNTTVTFTAKRPVRHVTEVTRTWDRFQSAADSPKCVSYLRDRGFPSPIATCRQYDLRFAPEGRWAQRLLIPVYVDGTVSTFTGRSLNPAVSPKYYMERTDKPVIYLPRPVRDTLVIVEGPIDALKIAVSTDNYQISSAALLGKSHSVAKIHAVADAATRCRRLIIALDEDVSYHLISELKLELRNSLDRIDVNHINILQDNGDPGAMSVEDINVWLADWRA